MSTRTRARAALIAAAVVAPLLVASPASAGFSMVRAGGVWTCSDTGVSEVVWTVYNDREFPVTVSEAVMSGAATGPVTFTGEAPADGGILSATTVELTPGTVGTIDFTAMVTEVTSEPLRYRVNASVNALACSGAETTTTTSTSTSTTSTTAPSSTTTSAVADPPAAAASVTAEPSFTG